MRRASADDSWRRITDKARQRAVTLQSLSFQDVVGLGTTSVDLHPALTVFCGSNGAGKSTMLNLCRAILEPIDEASVFRQRNSNARAFLQYTSAGQQISLSINTEHEGTTEVHFINSVAEWYRLKTLIETESNWAELLEQHGQRVLSPTELSEISFLVGKDYIECSVVEIDEYDTLKQPFPYFLVKCSEESYRFEDMGDGEAALFLTWWRLNRIREKSILLIEEPETHITPRSQRALMDIVATKCSKQCSCIMTTHSAEILTYIPRESLRMLTRLQGKVRIDPTPSTDILRLVLGVERVTKLVILVEDQCAAIITLQILKAYRPEIFMQSEICIAGSTSEIEEVLRRFPNTGTYRLFGVLDGDQRAKYRDVDTQFKHPFAFLPGNSAPELLLRNAAMSNLPALSLLLHVSEDKLIAILSSIQGEDHHDWIYSLVNAACISFEQGVCALFHCGRDAILEDCQNLANMIGQYTDSID